MNRIDEWYNVFYMGLEEKIWTCTFKFTDSYLLNYSLKVSFPTTPFIHIPPSAYPPNDQNKFTDK